MIYPCQLLVPVLTYLLMIPLGSSSHSIDTLVETLKTVLQNVLSWCNSNNMPLNVSKTILCISHLDTNSRLLQIVIMI